MSPDNKLDHIKKPLPDSSINFSMQLNRDKPPEIIDDDRAAMIYANELKRDM